MLKKLVSQSTVIKVKHFFPKLFDCQTNCLLIDYMHLSLQGHCKFKHNQFFFENKNLIVIGNHINEINILMSKLKLPHNFNRKLTSIEDSKKWKSSQYKTILFLCNNSNFDRFFNLLIIFIYHQVIYLL